MRIRIPGNQGIREMHVGQSVLRFGRGGYADADHLSDAEVQRCIDFHFVVEGGRATGAAKPPEPALPLYGEESRCATDDGQGEAGEDAGAKPVRAPRKTRPPHTSRRARKGAN